MKTFPALPRNAQIWLPGYLRSCVVPRTGVKRVYLTICDHFEPLRGGATLQTGMERVMRWRRAWPDIAERHTDSRGRPAQYTFFYPQEEYSSELIEPLAQIAHQGYGDVEIHIHHDGEGEQNFIDRISNFQETLFNKHGLLRQGDQRRIAFAFIHGNWALDNSRLDGRYCGLNNEITLLKHLGCYADFTMPAAPHASQSREINEIYWAVDDPARPKSYDRGIPFVPGGRRGDLLMIPGPLALNWRERSRGILPRLEVGELASHNPVTAERVRLWLEHSPLIGDSIFIKLFGHGAWESNSETLLNRGGLDSALSLVLQACAHRGWQVYWATAWQIRQFIIQREVPADRIGATLLSPDSSEERRPFEGSGRSITP